MSTLADRLTRALDAKAQGDAGASQAGLARYCKAKGPSVSDWFSGKTKTLKAQSLVMAAEYLGVRPRWLLDGNGPMYEVAGQRPALAVAPQPPSLTDALVILGEELATVDDEDVRVDVADALHKLAMRRGESRDQKIVADLLRAPPRKRIGNGG